MTAPARFDPDVPGEVLDHVDTLAPIVMFAIAAAACVVVAVLAMSVPVVVGSATTALACTGMAVIAGRRYHHTNKGSRDV